MTRARSALVLGALVAAVLAVWLSRGPGEPVQVVIPPGAGLSEVTDSLASADVIGMPALFRLYARARRADRALKAGTYEMRTEMSWGSALEQIRRGRVVTVSVTVPEGYRLTQMAERLAEVTHESGDEVLAYLRRPEVADRMGLPGPTLEGYLFPDTYRFAQGVPISAVVGTMVGRYKSVWTDERIDRLRELDMTEREVVTLASIIQAEARQVHEMPRISGVYHNRLESGWLLQADPTVLYALGGYRERLLYAAIDSVEDSPYNTYTQRGLPPGPIGAPGELAIEAAIEPEQHDFMYFVAMPDGSHVFTRTLAEHNRARADAVRAREGGRVGS